MTTQIYCTVCNEPILRGTYCYDCKVEKMKESHKWAQSYRKIHIKDLERPERKRPHFNPWLVKEKI